MFQLSLSLDSFKNNFVGDFGTLAHNPSPRPFATRPTTTLWTNIWYSSRYNFKDGYVKDDYAKDDYAKDGYATI